MITEDGRWLEWSSNALAAVAEVGLLYLDPIISAEVSVRFTRVEHLEAKLPPDDYRRGPLTWAAAFLAGTAFAEYRRRYRTYFPTVLLVTPDDGDGPAR